MSDLELGPFASLSDTVARYRGRLWDEWQIYVANTDDNPPKTFEEWLDS